jgi:hypothetical protein
MKQNNISDLPKLKNDRYENIFTVNTDEDGRYYYNLLQTVAFPQNLPDGYFDIYDIVYGDTWPYISYKVYNTINGWWLILLANNISNPIQALVPGTRIKIAKIQIAKIVVSQLQNQNN